MRPTNSKLLSIMLLSLQIHACKHKKARNNKPVYTVYMMVSHMHIPPACHQLPYCIGKVTFSWIPCKSFMWPLQLVPRAHCRWRMLSKWTNINYSIQNVMINIWSWTIACHHHTPIIIIHTYIKYRNKDKYTTNTIQLIASNYITKTFT